jgi:hypothetical protein
LSAEDCFAVCFFPLRKGEIVLRPETIGPAFIKSKGELNKKVENDQFCDLTRAESGKDRSEIPRSADSGRRLKPLVFEWIRED